MHLSQQDNLIAGISREGMLPPGLNTTLPPTELRVDQSPDSYGHSLSVDGKVGKGTIPAGTTRVAKSVTINCSDQNGGNAVPCLLYYGRLWNITGLTNSTASTTLKIGAPNYEDEWYFQSTDFAFNEDSNTILGIIPLGEGGMAVLKSSGIYIVENVYDPRGTQFFRRGDLVQEMAVDSLAHVTELDGVLYVCNTNGLFAYTQGRSIDLTAAVRDDKTNFKSLALKSDYVNKRIIATDDSSTGFVYDVPTEKLHYFSGSNFRFTTQEWHHPQWHEVVVDSLRFVIEHGDTEDGTLTYQYRCENEPWSDEVVVYMDYTGNDYTVLEAGLDEARRTYRFQVRVTDLSANKYIQEIRVVGETWNE